MEVHVGKCHSEIIECGLCAYEAKDSDNLNLHLATCEIYICNICPNKFKSLSDLKIYFVQKHREEVIFSAVAHF